VIVEGLLELLVKLPVYGQLIDDIDSFDLSAKAFFQRVQIRNPYDILRCGHGGLAFCNGR
jgi:hypothetical protein